MVICRTALSDPHQYTQQGRLNRINAEWRNTQQHSSPRRRRIAEVEGSGEESYKSKRQRYLEEVDKIPPSTTLSPTTKRPATPPLKQLEAVYIAPEPAREMRSIFQSKTQELLAQDPLALQAFGSLVLQTPLQFEIVNSGAKLEPDQLDACFKLVEKTSSADYKAAQAGWRPKEKKREMADDQMIYLLVKTKTKEAVVLGFISFMLTKDDPPSEYRSVVYMYEVHLDDGLRGCGLGSRLIAFVELLASRLGVLKTMLTVFRTNAGARELYKRLGYTKDVSSPADKVVRRRVIEADYIIMSKMWNDEY
jgi:ribosomal protein S18 acetylase RimI-like enzyme